MWWGGLLHCSPANPFLEVPGEISLATCFSFWTALSLTWILHSTRRQVCSGGRLFCVEAPPSTRLGLLLSKEVELWPEELWEIMEALCFQLLSSSILGYSASALV